jgi:hypothetical protein
MTQVLLDFLLVPVKSPLPRRCCCSAADQHNSDVAAQLCRAEKAASACAYNLQQLQSLTSLMPLDSSLLVSIIAPATSSKLLSAG